MKLIEKQIVSNLANYSSKNGDDLSISKYKFNIDKSREDINCKNCTKVNGEISNYCTSCGSTLI
ncbi:MAG: hypothetical protein ACLRMG_15495 [Clostridium sp.]